MGQQHPRSQRGTAAAAAPHRPGNRSRRKEVADHVGRLRARPSTSSTVLLSTFAALSLAHPTSSQSIPQLDFGALGSVSVVGSFAGLELYNASTSLVFPLNAPPPANSTSIPSTAGGSDILFELDSTGQLHRLADTSLGQIYAIATCSDSVDQVFFGGAFSALSGNTNGTNNIASYNTRTNTLSSLGQGLDGPVTALACDGVTGTLYAAGQFATPVGSSGASGYSGAVATYALSSKSWSPIGFGGFPRGSNTVDVRSIAFINRSDTSRSVLFGGDFTTYWANSTSSGSSSVNVTVASSQNGTLVISQANSTDLTSNNGTTANVFPSLGSALVPISLASAEVSSSSSSSNSLYQNPKNILCPLGTDGSPNSTWLAADDVIGRITARLFTPLVAGGFRLGNTLVNGDGTQTFSITALPSNEVLTLSYRTDPTSSTSSISTCSNSCPLSHDSSFPYEDFLISSSITSNGTITITGFEITLNTFYGSASGLHLLQLLSSATTAYAIDQQNAGWGDGVCASGPYPVYGRSSAINTASNNISWDHVSVASSTISGTEEGILCAPTPVDTNPADSATVTWYLYLAQDSDSYQVYFFTPSCTFDATCGQRGYVDVTISITGSDASQQTTTINQEVNDDTYTLIYSGPIRPIAGNDQVQVTMGLSKTSKATLAADKGNKYFLVADKIVVFAGDNTDGGGSTQIKIGSGMNSVNLTQTATGPSISYTNGYGLWEWIISSNDTASPTLNPSSVDVQDIPALSAATSIDKLGLALAQGANVTHMMVAPDNTDTLFIAGDFNYTPNGARSVLAYSIASGTGSIVNGGLAGTVAGIVALGGWLYAVGDFNATADGQVVGLHGKARWKYGNTTTSSWQPLKGLSNINSATSVSALDNDKLVFTYDEQNIDIWSPSNSSIIIGTNSFVIGSFATSQTAANASGVFLAGQTNALSQYAASGIALLSQDGLQPAHFGFDYTATAAASTASPSSKTKRSPSRSSLTDGPMNAFRNRLRGKRQSAALAVPSSLPIPADTNSSAPQVLAAAFWTNTTSNEDVTIIGGKFVSADDTVHNIAVLLPDGTLVPLSGVSLTGTVKSLKVVDSILWIGGDFSTSNGPSALAAYDLVASQWSSSIPLSLTAATGAPTISAIAERDTGDVVVAGHFETVDGVEGTASIAEWDQTSKSWKALGSGLQGVVGGVAFVNQSLFAAGSFVMNNSSTYVSVWSYATNSWSYLGANSVSGPALSVATDTDDNVFVSGIASGSVAETYLLHWNGTSWSDMSVQTANSANVATLTVTQSDIQQIVVVPLQSNAPENDIFSKNDRALLVSGALNIANLGSVSSALFDGSVWYPYLLSTNITGMPGNLAGFFFSTNNIVFGGNHDLAAGLVILISIAISFGIIFLGVLVALIIMLNTRSDDQQSYPVTGLSYGRADYGQATSPTPLLFNEKVKGKASPTPLLETINAATVAAIASGRNTESALLSSPERHDEAVASSEEDSMYDQDDVEEGDDSLPLRGVRYSFQAEREEELSISTGDMVEVVDDTDEHWHIVRRIRDGRQGLVPSAFLT